MSENDVASAAGVLAALQNSRANSFREMTSASVRRCAVSVYTIWSGAEFVYVGIGGRGLDEHAITAHAQNGKRKGLADRLNSHASGRRSGDQFCVYAADRLFLPGLTSTELESIAARTLWCALKGTR